MARAASIETNEYTERLERIVQQFPEIADAILRAGAAVLADEARARLERGFNGRASQLPGAFGITPVKAMKGMGMSIGGYNIKLGFDGYQNYVVRPNGHTYVFKKPVPFQLIARVRENGRKDPEQTAKPFMAPAIRAKKQEAWRRMDAEAERLLYKNAR